MSYILNKTDGSILTEIVDGSIDQTASDLTLIGKNSSSYGEFLNENLIHILENFANTTAPNHPVAGQLWFDTAENRMKVYDGNIFKVSGGTIVSTSIPSSISIGDIWIDSFNQQLYFNDGIANILAGPMYSKQQGISGLQTIDVLDINGNNHTIVLMYVAQVLLGLYSKDSFIPATDIPGYTGEILIGFNTGNYSGIKFHGQTSSADALLDPTDGSLKTALDFITTTQDVVSTGTMTIENSTPLVLGASSQNEIFIDNQAFNINSNIINQNFKINSLTSTGVTTAISVIGSTKRIGLYTTTPAATLDVNGDVIIQGNLTVNGDTTTFSADNLIIKDKLIELGNTDVPTNTTADGGGISLLAGLDGNKTILFKNNTSSWLFSENVNLLLGKSYKIAGVTVLDSGSLGSGVTASNLTSVGKLLQLQVDDININNSTISYVNISQTNGNIFLLPKGIGTVDVSSKRITSVANPVLPNDAVNLITMTNALKALSVTTTVYTNGMTNAQVASVYLDYLFPISEHADGTICRAVCSDFGIITIRTFNLIAGNWVFQSSIDITL